mmetsp:Transcript_22104/g.48323  ORF Transcript_22104/g.48323 Transcript_22104/m.48323 type:complete len:159 (-) Transcript_22104:58-534(-)
MLRVLLGIISLELPPEPSFLSEFFGVERGPDAQLQVPDESSTSSHKLSPAEARREGVGGPGGATGATWVVKVGAIATDDGAVPLDCATSCFGAATSTALPRQSGTINCTLPFRSLLSEFFGVARPDAHTPADWAASVSTGAGVADGGLERLRLGRLIV